MNKSLDIIPTPKHCEFTQGEPLAIKKVHCQLVTDKILENALILLGQESPFEYTVQEEAELIITDNLEAHFEEAELTFFKEKYAYEQGYIIKRAEDKLIIIAGHTQTGCAYGIMTLLQIIGKNISEIVIRDWPDFKRRGNKWTVWAESGIWSYDFGDGAEAMKKRIERKLDMSLKYKINTIYFDANGLNTDRTPEYADVMRFANDKARERGISLYTGCYGMSYGMSGYEGVYQGKAYLNRKSYPDGEVYKCIGSINPSFVNWAKKSYDRATRKIEVIAREHGTCLSNDALLKFKVAEMENYLKKTHCGGFYMHNMDSFEIYPEIWEARCEECRKRWPNDDLYAKDGAAGAFAEYFSEIADRLALIKDGDYDASKHLRIMVVSPGYLYPEVTCDEDFDIGMKFWAAVSKYMTADNLTIGFREEFFYHDKEVRRAESIKENTFEKDTHIINFSGADGFYDDRIFTITSVFHYMMKGYDGMFCANGNAFHEPLQVFNAEYLWNSENSGFYNLQDKPVNQKDFIKLYKEARGALVRPEEIYEKGGFLDIICEKLYGKKIGRKISEAYKVCGENGEPPVVCAASVAIDTGFEWANLPLRWDNEAMDKETLLKVKGQYAQCKLVSEKAADLVKDIPKSFDGNNETKEDLIWLCECFEMGRRLTSLLDQYTGFYLELYVHFYEGAELRADVYNEIVKLREEIATYQNFVENTARKAIDVLGGSIVRRKYMGEFFEENTALMLESIEDGKRITKPLQKKKWW